MSVPGRWAAGPTDADPGDRCRPPNGDREYADYFIVSSRSARSRPRISATQSPSLLRDFFFFARLAGFFVAFFFVVFFLAPLGFRERDGFFLEAGFFDALFAFFFDAAFVSAFFAVRVLFVFFRFAAFFFFVVFFAVFFRVAVLLARSALRDAGIPRLRLLLPALLFFFAALLFATI